MLAGQCRGTRLLRTGKALRRIIATIWVAECDQTRAATYQNRVLVLTRNYAGPLHRRLPGPMSEYAVIQTLFQLDTMTVPWKLTPASYEISRRATPRHGVARIPRVWLASTR